VCSVYAASCEDDKKVHSPPPELLACEAAAIGGHVPVLDWLRRYSLHLLLKFANRFESNRYIWSYRIMHHANQAGKAHVRRWALDMGIRDTV
jgi:hypothetical protein